MLTQIIRAASVVIFAFTFVACTRNAVEDTVMVSPKDPFIKTMSAVQTFTINSKEDNVVEGNDGTIIVCPKGCFKNRQGEVIETEVKLELAEALTLEDMVLSNLTTTSDGKPLETDGMIYFNATADEEQLVINKDNPIHIEMPTLKKKPGMMVYKGVRDENGNMNWVDPKALDNFLVIVNLDSLDFLPEGFQRAVDMGMPFRKYKTATKTLTDSLYYSLAASNGSDLTQGLISTDQNEPYYDKRKEVVNGKYVDKGNNEVGSIDSVVFVECGIDPAIVKTIKSAKFQNTLIATREFEARLKVIFSTCDKSILEIYVKNLDKNLYELDSMAAVACEEKKYYQGIHAFPEFSELRLTKVKEADKYARLLEGYYEKELSRIKSALEKEKEKVMKALAKENKDAQKVADNYKKLLWKREKYRMETYGFDWTDTGWINIDNGTRAKDWGSAPLEVVVENGKQFDRVYTYVVYSSIKSLHRLNAIDNENFYVGSEENKEMLMPKQKEGIIISIGYTGEIPSVAMKSFETGTDSKMTVTLKVSTEEEVRALLSRYEEFPKENRITADLKVMKKLFVEEQRQKKLIKESEFMGQLWCIAYPCCCDREL